jgi:RNA polymerase sigma-70 factor (ECF subfamily)
MPFEYLGRDVAGRFFASVFGPGRAVYELVPTTRANGQPAFGVYVNTPTGIRHSARLLVIGLSGERICAITGFDKSVLPSFGLPRSLPAGASGPRAAT